MPTPEPGTTGSGTPASPAPSSTPSSSWTSRACPTCSGRSSATTSSRAAGGARPRGRRRRPRRSSSPWPRRRSASPARWRSTSSPDASAATRRAPSPGRRPATAPTCGGSRARPARLQHRVRPVRADVGLRGLPRPRRRASTRPATTCRGRGRPARLGAGRGADAPRASCPASGCGWPAAATRARAARGDLYVQVAVARRPPLRARRATTSSSVLDLPFTRAAIGDDRRRRDARGLRRDRGEARHAAGRGHRAARPGDPGAGRARPRRPPDRGRRHDPAQADRRAARPAPGHSRATSTTGPTRPTRASSAACARPSGEPLPPARPGRRRRGRRSRACSSSSRRASRRSATARDVVLAGYAERRPRPTSSPRPSTPGWEDAWRAFHRPVRVGKLWIGPPWFEPRGDRRRHRSRAARSAPGAHGSTRAALELLGRLEPSAALDLGCGSGVLSIAAVRLGFGPLCGVRLDPLAVGATAENAARNGVERRGLPGRRPRRPAAAGAALAREPRAGPPAPPARASGPAGADPGLGADSRTRRSAASSGSRSTGGRRRSLRPVTRHTYRFFAAGRRRRVAILAPADRHHLEHVLRMRVGDTCEVAAGGRVHLARVAAGDWSSWRRSTP